MQTLNNFDNNERIDEQLSSLEDFMDIIAYTPATTLSTHTQTEEPVEVIEKHQTRQSVSNCTYHHSKNTTNLIRNVFICKSLFCSDSILFDSHEH